MKNIFFIFFLILLFIDCGPRSVNLESELMNLEREEEDLLEIEKQYMDASIQYLNGIIEKYPGNPFGADACLRLGEIYRAIAREKYDEDMDSWIAAGMPINQEPIIDYYDAKKMYEKVLSEYEGIDTTSAADAYYIFASLLEEEGNIDSASILYRRLVVRFPYSFRVPASCFRLGLYYFTFRDEGTSKIDLALDYFNKVLEFPTDPNFDKAIYMIGWLNKIEVTYGFTDSIIPSITHFLYLLELSGQEGRTELAEEAIMYLGIDFSELNNGTERARRVLTVLGDLPKGPEVIYKLAETYKDKVDFAKAIEAYNVFLGMYPNNPKAPFVLKDMAALYSEVGDIEMAEETMDRLVENYGGDWMAENVAYDTMEAVSTDSLIKEAMLYSAGVHHTRALEEGTIEEWQEAAQRYSQFLQKYPNDQDAYGIRFAYAEALYEIGNYLDAGYEYTNVLLDTLTSNDSLSLAAAYEAVTSYNQWYSEDSTSQKRADSLVNAASRYIDEWEISSGEAIENPVNISMTAGKILYEGGKYYDARFWYEKVVSDFALSPAVPAAAAMVAQCYYQEDNLVLAEEWFNKAANIGGDTSLTQQAAIIAFQSADEYSENDTLKAVAFIDVYEKYPQKDEGKTALYNAGIIFHNAGNDKRALDILNRYITSFSYIDDSLLYSAYINIANISLERAEKADEEGLVASNLWIEAAIALENVSIKYPETQEGAQAVLWAGKAYYGAKDYLNASNSFQLISNQTSFSEEIHYEALHKLAQCYDSLGLNADAMNVRRQIYEDYFSGGFGAGISPADLDKDMLEISEEEFNEIVGFILTWPIDRSFPSYDSKMKAVAEKFTNLASLRTGEITVASLYFLGRCNEDYARAYREAEYNPSWGEEEQIYFLEELELYAMPYEEYAVQYYLAAENLAIENSLTGSQWYNKNNQAINNLKIFRPDLFPEEEIEYYETIEDSLSVDSDSIIVDSTVVDSIFIDETSNDTIE